MMILEMDFMSADVRPRPPRCAVPSSRSSLPRNAFVRESGWLKISFSMKCGNPFFSMRAISQSTVSTRSLSRPLLEEIPARLTFTTSPSPR